MSAFIEPTDKVIRSVAVRLNPNDQNPTKVPLGALADNIKLDTSITTISPIMSDLQPFNMPENVQEFATKTQRYLNNYFDRLQEIDTQKEQSLIGRQIITSYVTNASDVEKSLPIACGCFNNRSNAPQFQQEDSSILLSVKFNAAADGSGTKKPQNGLLLIGLRADDDNNIRNNQVTFGWLAVTKYMPDCLKLWTYNNVWALRWKPSATHTQKSSITIEILSQSHSSGASGVSYLFGGNVGADNYTNNENTIANLIVTQDGTFESHVFSLSYLGQVSKSDIANMVTFNEKQSIVVTRDTSDYSHLSNSIVFGDVYHNNLVGALNIVFGENNSANQSYAVTVGDRNNLAGNHSLTIGTDNISNGHNNVSIGQNNNIQANNTYCFGHDNELSSTSDTIVYGLIGTGLKKTVNPIKSGLICGQYNDHVDDQSHVFSVGIGDDENSRKTGFFVNTNGSAYVDGNFRVGQAVVNESVGGTGTILSRALHIYQDATINGYLEIGGSHLIDNNAVDILHGNLRLDEGTVIGSGGDYAEYIKPWYDNNLRMQDRSGYMVTIKNGALQKAGIDDHIIGITSKTPSIIGNSRAIPENDNPDTWSCVGLRGFVEVYDDGSCEPETFCKCGGNGIATKADTQGFETYFVIERINENKILVEVK